MVNSSTNINKTNNHLSPQFTEHKKKHTTYDVGNPSPSLRRAQNAFIFIFATTIILPPLNISTTLFFPSLKKKMFNSFNAHYDIQIYRCISVISYIRNQEVVLDIRE